MNRRNSIAHRAGVGSPSAPSHEPIFTFNAAAGAVVNPSDRTGGTLRLVSQNDVDHLDPARGRYAFVWNLMRLYARTLVTFDSKPGRDGTRLVPDLAESLADVTDGGRTYRYRLRPGLAFEDGTPIRSYDVKYGIERCFAQQELSGGAVFLVDVLDQGQRYPGPYADPEPDKLGLRSIETPDARTVVFTLAEPFSEFEYMLATPVAAPVPRERDTGAAYTARPVSSGPYVISARNPGEMIVWTRNPHWCREIDPVRRALPDRIELTVGIPHEEVDRRLLAGEADIDAAQAGLQEPARRRVNGDPGLRRFADSVPTGRIWYLSVQLGVPPFDDVHCRRAVQYAVDKVAVQQARGVVGGGSISSTVLPPNLPGYRPFDRYPCGHDQRGDVEAARRELAAAGLPDGFETVIACRDRATESKPAEAIAAALARVGIRARVVTYPATSYFRDVLGVPSEVRAHGIGLAICGWGPDFPTAYGFLGEMVDGRRIRARGNSNYAELDDPEVHRLIDRALAAGDEAERAELWHLADRRVMECAAIVPLVYDTAFNYRGPRATNVYVHEAYFGMYDFQALGVAEETTTPRHRVDSASRHHCGRSG